MYIFGEAEIMEGSREYVRFREYVRRLLSTAYIFPGTDSSSPVHPFVGLAGNWVDRPDAD